MAITTNAQAIAEINAALLVDGLNIKQLLLDLSAYLQSAASLPTATTTAIGGVLKAADVPAASGWTDATAMANFNALLTSIKAAGQMA